MHASNYAILSTKLTAINETIQYIIKENCAVGRPWPPLVTGLTSLHDNAASPDAYR